MHEMNHRTAVDARNDERASNSCRIVGSNLSRTGKRPRTIPDEDRQARLQTRSLFLFAGVNRRRFSAIRVVDVVDGGIRN